MPAPGVEVSVPIGHMAHVDRNLIGTRYGSARPHYDIALFVQLYLDGKLKLDELVTKTYPLDQFDTVAHDMEEGKLARGVLTF
ncbi:MAG TPA: hypothetical protein VF942_17140 [Acidimicrobiales bacterium]